MRHNFNIFRFVFIGFLASLSLFSCSCSNIKLHPEYTGVDPKVQGLVNEYKELAKIQGITFHKEVTVGFKDLESNSSFGLSKRMNDGNNSSIVGMCSYGPGWREIDLDTFYWNHSDANSRLEELFHELTHCYCNRDHDYSYGKDYPEAEEINDFNYKKPQEGYYPDGCPLSIMYPVVLDGQCLMRHYDTYTVEMFSRCEPF